MDYGGITGLVFGTMYAVFHYCFACNEVFYIRMICVGIMLVGSIACFSVTFIKVFDSPKYRPVRAGMFIGLGVSTVVFVTYIGVA